jgi:uncharacterized protein
VGATFYRLDRSSPPPSFVSGRMNSLSSVAVRLVPRRLALAVSGRLLGD